MNKSIQKNGFRREREKLQKRNASHETRLPTEYLYEIHIYVDIGNHNFTKKKKIEKILK